MLAFNLKIWEWLNRSARHAVKAVALVVLIDKLAHNSSNSVCYHKHYEKKLAQFMPGPGNLL